MWFRREIGQNLVGLLPVSDQSSTPYEVRSEPRGSHWIAWLTRTGAPTSDRSIVLVGETRETAEENARRFAAQTRY
jgi:hypothetical protein